jgi:LPXTG-motif cell wall-anchored protein
MKDAFNVLESYKVDGGYVYDTAYGTDPNADSTALALMAYCSVFFDVDDDDYDAYVEKVNGIYDDLCAFEGSTTGVFQYYGEDNAYATSDALKGLEEYYLIAFIQDFDFDLDPDDEEELTTTPTTKNETTTKKSETTTKKNTSKTSPQTGASTGAIALSVALAGAGLTLFALKKKEQ